MRLIKPLTERIKKFVKGNGGPLPKLFVWVYASVFIACGVLTIIGIVYEFATKGAVNYKAVNEFVAQYFAPSIAGTFALLGVLLIDRDNDGIPDKWEEQEQEKDGDKK
jgi:hypothetical protein